MTSGDVNSVESAGTTAVSVIDISSLASRYRLVVFGMYFMMITSCMTVPGIVVVAVTRSLGAVDVIALVPLLVGHVLCAAFCLRWSDNLDAIVHPYMLCAFAFVAVAGEWLALCGTWSDGANAPATPALAGIAAVIAIVAVLALRRGRVQRLDVSVHDLLKYRFVRTPGPKVPRHQGWLRWLYLLLAFCWFGGLSVATDFFAEHNILSAMGYAQALGGLLLLWARSYVKPAFGTISKLDPRPPVLFLRSFDNDRSVYPNSKSNNRWTSLGFWGYGLVDFSLESRLATHFATFGPFIAARAASRGHFANQWPELGAVRFEMSDDKWHTQVVALMEKSKIVVVMAGVSRWVRWEMETLIQAGHASKMLVVFPSPHRTRKAEEEHCVITTAHRLAYMSGALRGTAWEPAINELEHECNPEQLCAILLEPQGRIVAILSDVRHRASYHLAAVIAHAMMEDQRTGAGAENSVPGVTPARSSVPQSARVIPRLLLVAASIAACSAIVFRSAYPVAKLPCVPFGTRDVVCYESSASKEMADALGHALQHVGFFSDNGAGVRLAVDENGHPVISFVIGREYLDQEWVAPSLERMVISVMPAVGAGPVTVKLLDPAGKVQRTLDLGQSY